MSEAFTVSELYLIKYVNIEVCRSNEDIMRGYRVGPVKRAYRYCLCVLFL